MNPRATRGGRGGERYADECSRNHRLVSRVAGSLDEINHERSIREWYSNVWRVYELQRDMVKISGLSRVVAVELIDEQGIYGEDRECSVH